MAELLARWHRSIAELPEQAWDGLLADDLPFYRWRWLRELEHSGSVVPREGWQSCHLALWRGEQLLAVAPLYLKGHSYGEFVFDQSFAQLAGQLGLRYYPKLVGMSPVSPVQGYRFLIAPGEDAAALTALMLELIDAFCLEHGILSCNFLYVDPAWRPLAEAAGCAVWINQQSQWSNPGHADFSDYLASFNANQRRNIRRERKAVQEAGVQVTPLVGEAIPAPLVERMHDFYAQHCARWGPWGSKYLSEAFFAALAADPGLRRHLVLFSAHRGDPGEPLAMSLCVRGGDHLWGRYWGSDVDLDCLHFEVCYYAPIAWAIETGLAHFDPGAGGSHKRRRGFVAQPRVSLHRWSDPRFDTILRNWLPGANAAMAREIEAINAELPFNAAYDPPHVPQSIATAVPPAPG
ncbi:MULTISPECIES: GNAT family N-acetyltransferase [Aphanothece]|uniref:GNAT family N-acetyltransferase n=1 Tax=Aphanothece TaxID=1121 RepID=UPI003984652B